MQGNWAKEGTNRKDEMIIDFPAKVKKATIV